MVADALKLFSKFTYAECCSTSALQINPDNFSEWPTRSKSGLWPHSWSWPL